MIYDKNFEPYIGMPIYLDDNLFDCNQGMMPTAPTMPMNPNQGMVPTAPMARGTGRCMPNQCMQDQCEQNQIRGVMPIENIMPTEPEQCMMNQGTMETTDTGNMQMGNMLNDCAAGCPLAMAYVPWQPWETPYEDEVAFGVGTVFPSLNLPFLGGKRK